ncbi:MAG: GAF domain-containing protein [Proteobacteria bacterium]|nr:GAF domain-containing protein [Pseudomonadota bacterium]
MTKTLEQDLRAIALAWQDSAQPQATFEAVGEALKRHVGYGLYTITHALPGGKEVERLYSTNEAAYAVGGRKPVQKDAFREKVFGTHQAFLGRSPADFKPYFPDHDFIVSLGLGSVINVPVVVGGIALGSVNILDREGAYDETHVEKATAIARMVAPALLGCSQMVAG